MQAESSVEVNSSDRQMSVTQRLALIAINAIPFLVILISISLFLSLPLSIIPRLAVVAGIPLIFLPIAARVIMALAPIQEGAAAIGSRTFYTWWILFQLQMIFSRLSFIEESMRLVPGLYSAWLRLWGANIGRLTVWGPGTKILDRCLLDIGDDVILGNSVRIASHYFTRNKRGCMELVIGRVRIGDGCLAGAFSLISAGTVLEPYSSTHAFFRSRPFGTWNNMKTQAHPDQ